MRAKKEKMKPWKIVVLGITAVIIVAVIAVGIYLKVTYDKIYVDPNEDIETTFEATPDFWDEIPTPEITPTPAVTPSPGVDTTPEVTPTPVSTPTPTPVPKPIKINVPNIKNKGIINIGVLGIDVFGSSEDMVGRSDVIMILSIDTVNNKLYLTSMLRDTQVYLRYKDRYEKATHAHAYNGMKGARYMIADELGSGFDTNKLIRFNFSCIVKFIDALGGVDIELDAREAEQVDAFGNDIYLKVYGSYDNGPGITNTNSIAGTYTLNGAQACGYMRIRKIDSDANRVGRQQKVISALVEKFKNASLTDLIEIAKECADAGYFNTTMKLKEIIEVITAAYPAMQNGIDSATYPSAYKSANVGGFYVAIPKDKKADVKALYQRIYGVDVTFG